MYSLYKSMVVLETSVTSLSLYAIRLFLAYLTSALDSIHAPTCGYRSDDGDLQFNSATVT